MNIWKPSFQSLLIAFVMLLFGVFSSSNETFDINIHDTYFIIRYCDFFYFLTALFSVFGILYFFLKKLNLLHSKILAFIHVYGTMLGFVIVVFCNYKLQLATMPRRYYTNSTFNDFEVYGQLMIFVFFMFIFLQVLFLINIFASLIKKRSNSVSQ